MPHPKYEFNVITFESDDEFAKVVGDIYSNESVAAYLNSIGYDGWFLVSYRNNKRADNSIFRQFIFSRPIR